MWRYWEQDSLRRRRAWDSMSRVTKPQLTPPTGILPPQLYLPLPPLAPEVVSLTEDFRLKLHNMHTGESLDIVYRVGDTYLPEAVEKLNYFLRDHYTQDVANYDPKEFDVLHNVLERLRRPDGIIDVVCGYRTPETNEAAAPELAPGPASLNIASTWKVMPSTSAFPESQPRLCVTQP